MAAPAAGGERRRPEFTFYLSCDVGLQVGRLPGPAPIAAAPRPAPPTAEPPAPHGL